MSGSSQLEAALSVLERGGVVGMPTETVYGLAGDATSAQAVAEIYRLKGRPLDHPVIVHLADASWVDRWAQSVPVWARELMEQFWPGPLTFIVPRLPHVGDWVTGGQETVGLRVPAHPLAQSLLRHFGRGLAAPSANRFGRVSPTTASHVEGEFKDLRTLGCPLIVLDGGPCRVGLESTIVDATGSQPRISRPGQLGPSIAKIAGGADLPRVPGSLASHYAPRVDCRMWEGQSLGPNQALLRFRSQATWPEIAVGQNADEAGQRFYALLRELEQQDLETIFIEPTPPGPEWDALRDRIQRATYH